MELFGLLVGYCDILISYIFIFGWTIPLNIKMFYTNSVFNTAYFLRNSNIKLHMNESHRDQVSVFTECT